MDGAISDDPSPDGTSAFAMNLAKGNYIIVELFLRSKIEPKEEMEAMFKASKELGQADPCQPIDKEWVFYYKYHENIGASH